MEGLKLTKVGKEVGDEFNEKSDVFQGDDVKVTFLLEDGTSSNGSFKTGQDVAFLKVWVEKQHKMPFDTIDLIYDGRNMPDPLSLTDLGIKAGDIKINVKKSSS